MFKQLHWLALSTRNKFKVFILVFKAQHAGSCPVAVLFFVWGVKGDFCLVGYITFIWYESHIDVMQYLRCFYEY